MELAKISIDGKITAISAAAIAKKIVDFILTSGPKPDPDAQIAEGAASGQSGEYRIGYEYRIGDAWIDESEGKPRILQNRINIEYGFGYIYGSYRYSYGDTVSLKRTVRESGSGGGFSFYGRYDFKYFECYVDMGVIDSTGTADELGILMGFLAKYPFVLDQVPVKVTPILGIGGIMIDGDFFPGGFMFGGRIEVGISEITYLRSEYLQAVGDGSVGISLKVGGGLDIGLGKKKKAFWRTELMYNWLSAYNKEYTAQNIYGKDERRVDGKSAINYVDIRTGIGYKWGGVKKVQVEIREIGAR